MSSGGNRSFMNEQRIASEMMKHILRENAEFYSMFFFFQRRDHNSPTIFAGLPETSQAVCMKVWPSIYDLSDNYFWSENYKIMNEYCFHAITGRITGSTGSFTSLLEGNMFDGLPPAISLRHWLIEQYGVGGRFIWFAKVAGEKFFCWITKIWLQRQVSFPNFRT